MIHYQALTEVELLRNYGGNLKILKCLTEDLSNRGGSRRAKAKVRC